ncbi:MAG: hypothetical protein ACKOYQ_06435 [Actinomycetota bacterium]
MTHTSRAMRSIALPIGVLALAGFALTACGGSSDSRSSSSAAPASSSEPPAPNPNPEGDCSQEALNSAASAATGGSFGGVEEYTCDAGWAVVSGKMNDQYTSLVFKAEDGSWMPKEVQETCQAGELPATIAEIACN